MIQPNEPYVTPEWAPDCRCGVCHTCLPAIKTPPNITLGEN